MTVSRDSRTHSIIGAAMRIHSELGSGYLEKVYHDALEVEFLERGIPYVREAAVAVTYRGVTLGHCYYPDFICHGEVVVEVKSKADLADPDRNQVIHYLKGTGLRTGLLLNFGEARLDFQRYIYDRAWHVDPVPTPEHGVGGGI